MTDPSCEMLLEMLTVEYDRCTTATERNTYNEYRLAVQNVIRRLTQTQGTVVYDLMSERVIYQVK